MTLILSYNQYYSYFSYWTTRKIEPPKYIISQITFGPYGRKYHLTFEDEEELLIAKLACQI